jgi:hypothetical protein
VAPLPLVLPPEMLRLTIRLRPSEPELGDDLALFLCRHGCFAEVAKDGTVVAELPHVLHQEQARMELGLYICLWQALHGVKCPDRSPRLDLPPEQPGDVGGRACAASGGLRTS